MSLYQEMQKKAVTASIGSDIGKKIDSGIQTVEDAVGTVGDVLEEGNKNFNETKDNVLGKIEAGADYVQAAPSKVADFLKKKVGMKTGEEKYTDARKRFLNNMKLRQTTSAKEVAKYRGRFEEAEKALETSNNDLAGMTDSAAMLNKKLSGLQGDYNNMKLRQTTSAKEAAKYRGRFEEAEKALETSNNDLAGMTDSAAMLNKKLSGLQGDYQTSQEEVKRHKADAAAHLENFSKMEGLLSASEISEKDAKLQAAMLNKKLSGLQGDYQTSQEEIKRHKADAAAHLENFSKMEGLLSASEISEKDAKMQAAIAGKDLVAKDKELQAAKSSIQAQKQEITNLTNAVKTGKTNAKKASERIQELETSIKDTAGKTIQDHATKYWGDMSAGAQVAAGGAAIAGAGLMAYGLYSALFGDEEEEQYAGMQRTASTQAFLQGYKTSENNSVERTAFLEGYLTKEAKRKSLGRPSSHLPRNRDAVKASRKSAEKGAHKTDPRPKAKPKAKPKTTPKEKPKVEVESPAKADSTPTSMKDVLFNIFSPTKVAGATGVVTAGVAYNSEVDDIQAEQAAADKEGLQLDADLSTAKQEAEDAKAAALKAANEKKFAAGKAKAESETLSNRVSDVASSIKTKLKGLTPGQQVGAGAAGLAGLGALGYAGYKGYKALTEDEDEKANA